MYVFKLFLSNDKGGGKGKPRTRETEAPQGFRDIQPSFQRRRFITFSLGHCTASHYIVFLQAEILLQKKHKHFVINKINKYSDESESSKRVD